MGTIVVVGTNIMVEFLYWKNIVGEKQNKVERRAKKHFRLT
jgi:hypothetical protein